MNIQSTFNRIFVITVLVCIAPVFPSAASVETDAITRSERPAVEVMFVLDTTGSMGGMIAAAKDKIWSIANTLASADPAPEIKMGLVGYRDRGDAYVTKLTSLSDNLDAVYTRLMAFEAGGGGDHPESVNQALYEAVTKADWSSSPETYRVIFLVGDAPPQMNYVNDVKYSESCRLAVDKNIIINTIQCGQMPDTSSSWNNVAQLGKGQYFQVAQTGSAVLCDTPYDDEISSLSRKLDETRIYYGNAEQLKQKEEWKRKADKIYASAKPSAIAKRTIFNAKKAGAKNFAGSGELVQAVGAGKVALASIPKKQLPPELRAMNEAELRAHVDRTADERKSLQSRIGQLAKKRQIYIAKKVNAEKDAGASSLDARIYQCIRSQAVNKGIHYTQGPEY